MDIVTLAAARKGGGSGGDVTRQYVDEHLALKADKAETAEYPIADTTTAVNPTITDSADGFVQGLTVYGESRVSKNLFDNDTVVPGYIEASGNVRTDGVFGTNYKTSDYIDITNANSICLTGITTVASSGFAFYDASKNFVSGLALNTIIENPVITVPQTAKYCRFSFAVSTDDLNTAQLELGSIPTPYEPYFSGIRGIGEDGELEITTANSDSFEGSIAAVTISIPLYSAGDVKDEWNEKRGVMVKGCEKKNLNDFEWTLISNNRWKTPLINAKSVTNLEIINAISNNYTAVSAQALYEYEQLIGMALTFNNDLVIRNGSDTDTPTGYIVYELAEPYEIPLTSAELSALRNLRTYNPTTNVTVTDDPTIEVGYLLNTNNGQAVADVQNELQGQIIAIPAFFAAIPEMHRNIFRGKNLGTAVTAAQLAAIEDGSFDDLYVGDYWTIPTTIDGTLKDVKYRIIDADYFLNRGTSATKVTAHHLVIMPDDSIATAPYNTTAAQVFFKTSSLYTTTLPAINTTLTGIFGNNLLEHTIPVEASSALFAREWATLKADIPSMSQVIGSTINVNRIDKDTGNTQPLFALFALCPRFLTSESASIWWLRDLYAAESSSTQAQVMGNGGMLAYMNFTTAEGVRPYFLIGVSDANNS